jgi:hypothetical protein
MAAASQQQKLRKEMTMSTNTQELELRPLEDRQLEMAHAVDAIDQALSKAGLTWSWLAQIVAGGVARHAQRRGGAWRRMLPPTALDLSSFFGEWARNPQMGARATIRAGRRECSIPDATRVS